ncbi:MAG: hypothetical protein HKP27_04235, partial [Myxococcales bacterium]|nr:hypothetical protein [Myxococcales bacterium]
MKKRPAFHAASVTPACTPDRRRLSSLLVLSLLLSLPGVAWGQEESTTPEWDRRLVFTEDVIAAAKLQGSDQIIGVGEFGMLALIDFNEKEISKAELVETEITEDLNDVVAMPDGSAVIGSASGNILRYADGKLEVVQNVGNDSVLDLGVQRDASGSIVALWAAGGRGILAVSRDGGETWEDAAPTEVSQPALPLPNNRPGIWFSGVANVIEDSVVLNANVNGRPAELGKDYKMTYE